MTRRLQNNPQYALLTQVRDVLNGYALEHRAKGHRLEKAALGCSDEVECASLLQQAETTKTKAEANEKWVKRLDTAIEGPLDNVLERTAEFGIIVHPQGFTKVSHQAQLGVHFEEVAEMLETFTSSDVATQKLIEEAYVAVAALGENLKSTSSTPTIDVHDTLGYLDSVADQLVTVTLSAVQMGMNPVGALREVNRSNFSKLTDGKMAIDPSNNKWIKGPDYSAPRLTPFLY